MILFKVMLVACSRKIWSSSFRKKKVPRVRACTHGDGACAHRALGFFKYSRIIYRWKAYEEVITTIEEKNENFHFWAQNGHVQIQVRYCRNLVLMCIIVPGLAIDFYIFYKTLLQCRTHIVFKCLQYRTFKRFKLFYPAVTKS